MESSRIERGKRDPMRYLRPHPEIAGGFSLLTLGVAVAMVVIGYIYR